MLTQLFDCCQRVLRGEPQMLAQLQAAGFVCAAGHWQFELPELHQYLHSLLGEADSCAYPGFIRQLYGSDLNQRLQRLGGEIVILDNQQKVSQSRYCLRLL
jgi:hypothetical protein